MGRKLFVFFFRLAQEEEVIQARTKAEELERENADLATNLAKREQELDLKHQEKEDLEANLARAKEKLETEILCHNETKQRLSAVESRVVVSDIKLVNAVDVATKLPPPPPPAAPPPPMPPGPPPPPMMNGGPPTMAQTEQLRQAIRKCVPQPSNPLKSFNWSKLPECKVQGTIWTDLDDSRLYKQLDLQEVDRLFSAYQKNGIMVSHPLIMHINMRKLNCHKLMRANKRISPRIVKLIHPFRLQKEL